MGVNEINIPHNFHLNTTFISWPPCSESISLFIKIIAFNYKGNYFVREEKSLVKKQNNTGT